MPENEPSVPEAGTTLDDHPVGTVTAAPPPPVLHAAPLQNRLSVWAVVAMIFFSPAGLVLGHIALHQIKKTGQTGKVQAVVAIVWGYLTIGGLLVILALNALFPGPSPQTKVADCSVSESALSALTDGMHANLTTLSSDPTGSQSAMAREIATFKHDTALVSYPAVKSELRIIDEQLDTLSTAVAHVVAAPADQTAIEAVNTSAAALSAELDDLSAFCTPGAEG